MQPLSPTELCLTSINLHDKMSPKMDQNVLMPWQQKKDADWALNNQLSNWEHLLSWLVQSTIMSSVRRWMWIKNDEESCLRKNKYLRYHMKKPQKHCSLPAVRRYRDKSAIFCDKSLDQKRLWLRQCFLSGGRLCHFISTVKEHWCDTSVRNVMTPSLKTTRQYYKITTASLEKLTSD